MAENGTGLGIREEPVDLYEYVKNKFTFDNDKAPLSGEQIGCERLF